jgi:hypothetical protein
MLRRPVSNAAHWLVIAVLVGAPAAFSGCGSATLDHNETPEDPLAPRPVDPSSRLEPVPLTELAERLSAALCQALDSCCHAAALGSSAADCRERTRADYEAQLATTSARAVRYDPISGARCVAAFTHFLRSCSYDGKGESDAACKGLFRGTQGLDESCETDAECAPGPAPGVYCAGDLGPRAHTCQAALQEGEQCLLEGCARGLACDFGTLSCQPQRTEGECFQFQECADDSVCAPSGQCEPKLAAGQPCVIELQCQSGVCGTDGLCKGSFANSDTCVSP